MTSYKLDVEKIPTSKEIIDSIKASHSKFVKGNDFNLLKAIDAVKDGAPSAISRECFKDKDKDTLPSPLPSPDDLKKFIRKLFDDLVDGNELRLIPYTRRKGLDETLEGVHPDFVIPDCGPNYEKGNGKTPEIKTAGGTHPILLYSLGNKLDTGPSSSNSINLKVDSKDYTIHEDVMTALGYKGSEMININDNDNNNNPSFNLKINDLSFDYNRFNEFAMGNNAKNRILKQSDNLPEKKALLFIKSWGDTFICFYWLWACKQFTYKNIALLTCDCVLAYQAYILGREKNNGQFLLNYNEKGEKKTSKVYYKGAPPNYTNLMILEKNEIIHMYESEIEKFKNIYNNDSIFKFIGDENEYQNEELIELIIERLGEEVNEIYKIPLSNKKDDYINLKSFAFKPLISGLERRSGLYMLIRGRNQFSIADQTFLNESPGKRLSLYDYRYYNMDTSDGRNYTENGYFFHPFGGISGGRNNKKIVDINNREDDNEDNEYYYDKEIKNPNELAIDHLKDFIWETFKKLLYFPNSKDSTDLYTKFFVKYLGFSKEEIYDEMTYYFHWIPDYTDENIEVIINNIINSYFIPNEIKPPRKKKTFVDKTRNSIKNQKQEQRKKEKGKFSNRPKDRQKENTRRKKINVELIKEAVSNRNFNTAITGGKKMNSVSKQKKNARSTRRKRNNKIE